ncbi:MAG: TIGR02449 family protein [Pseudomonadales bacterium]|jgi:cell division protein ZapB|nr:TIGR02449 family protein [Pseudomonadales bacterium]
MSPIDLSALERRIDELVRLCDQLTRENQALQARHQDWAHERARLVEKNELAKHKVESMIGRLKSLEQEG